MTSATTPPELYLAIDLDAKTDDALEAMPDDLPFRGLAAVLTDPAINGDGWWRHWRAFPADQIEQAREYQRTHPTVVLVPFTSAPPAETEPAG